MRLTTLLMIATLCLFPLTAVVFEQQDVNLVDNPDASRTSRNCDPAFDSTLNGLTFTPDEPVVLEIDLSCFEYQLIYDADSDGKMDFDLQVHLYEENSGNSELIWFANQDSENCVGFNCILWDFDQGSTFFTEIFYLNGPVNNDAENDNELWPLAANNLTPYTNYTVQVSLISLNQTYDHTESHSFSIFGDLDDDGVEDINDNCPTEPNPQQLDIDSDGIGDVCDSDKDGDRILDTSDNCPLVQNPNQANMDGDAQGDACDADIDGDNVTNVAPLHVSSGTSQDLCPYVDATGKDEDLDGCIDEVEPVECEICEVPGKGNETNTLLDPDDVGTVATVGGIGIILGLSIAYGAMKALNLVRFERTSSNDLAHMPMRKTADLYSDHYSQRGIVRQQEMTLSARMELDDYVTEENEGDETDE